MRERCCSSWLLELQTLVRRWRIFIGLCLQCTKMALLDSFRMVERPPHVLLWLGSLLWIYGLINLVGGWEYLPVVHGPLNAPALRVLVVTVLFV